jgi:hypothetical protein
VARVLLDAENGVLDVRQKARLILFHVGQRR